MKEINNALLKEFRAAYDRDAAARTLNSALAKTDLADLSFVPMQAALHQGPFAVEVKTRGITAQQKSGRCWLFAALNIMREIVAEKCGLEEFELSQNYLSFYDKLEKANNFLEMVIEQAGEPVKGQSMQYVLRGMVDGGYWSEAAHLAAKYGVVPKAANPESYQSEHTDRFLAAMNRLLRKDALELRELVAAGKDPYPRKKEMLAEVYKAECIAFGAPVETFDFAWRDKDKNYHCDRNLTPREFYDKYVGLALEDYMPVINEPTPDKEMDTPVAFHAVENMVGKDMEALNLSQEALEDLCIRQLQAGEPVWWCLWSPERRDLGSGQCPGGKAPGRIFLGYAQRQEAGIRSQFRHPCHAPDRGGFRCLRPSHPVEDREFLGQGSGKERLFCLLRKVFQRIRLRSRDQKMPFHSGTKRNAEKRTHPDQSLG